MSEDKKTPRTNPREQGIVLFVIKYGVLAWGVSAGVAYFLMEMARHASDLAGKAAYALTVFPIIGLVAGLMIWFFGGKKKG